MQYLNILKYKKIAIFLCYHSQRLILENLVMVKNNITNLREKADMSVYELAKRCGFISVGRVLGKKISDAEDGKNITIESAMTIYNELKKAGVCEKFEDVFWLEPVNKDNQLPSG